MAPTIVKDTVSAALTLPSASAWVALTVCGPRGSATVGEHDHVPFVATTAVQRTVEPSVTVTVAPASPVPLINGVVSWTDAPSAGATITGAAGGTVSPLSGTIVTVVVAVSVLPAGSSAVTVSVCSPGSSGSAGSHDQVPSDCTVVVQTVSPPSVTVIDAPASPVPDTAGVGSEVLDPSTGVSTSTVVVVSTSKVTVSGADVLPASSVAVAE